MGLRVLFLLCYTTAALVCVSSRAVNISNTWMLPEEGFPVFYRYFRDRISWYEADAVCQFHHANLVTVDTTSEFDAVRAYLKELDIANNVWIGLTKNGEKSKFTWSNFRPLSNEGYWQEAIPVGTNPLCAVADPVADYRWHALPCGGPEVSAFICELPVPLWATGSGGCLLTEIPSLTVLYIPEQSALELTSDCGLDGTKRISCKGNADRDEMIKQLACAITNDDEDDKTTKFPNAIEVTTPIFKTTKPWSSNTIESEDYGVPTRHRRETENTLSPVTSTISTWDLATREIGVTTDLPETSTVSSINDVTLGFSVTQSDENVNTKSSVTSEVDAVTNNSDTYLDVQYEFFITVTPQESGQDDTAEYINQGHLFSLLENGTLFDIIELNDTGTEDSSIVSVNPEATTFERLTSAVYTTVIYHQEPTEATDQNGEMGYKQEVTPTFKQEYTDKTLKKQKTVNDLLNKEDDKALTKEMEQLPILPDTSTNLNRTGRKKVPREHEEDDFVIVDDSVSHKIVEIKLHKDDSNSSHPQLFITTRIAEKSKKLDKQFKGTIKKDDSTLATAEPVLHTTTESDKIEKETPFAVDDKISVTTSTEIDITTAFILTDHPNKGTTKQTSSTTQNPNMEFEPIPEVEPEVKEMEIDPKIDILNAENITANFESESITHLKKQLLPKSVLESDAETNDANEVVADEPQETASTAAPTDEPLDTIPQQQKPNRQRLLSKPQRRSFYPYFFSRVLG